MLFFFRKEWSFLSYKTLSKHRILFCHAKLIMMETLMMMQTTVYLVLEFQLRYISKIKLKRSAVSPVSLASILRAARTTLDHTRLLLEDLK